MKKQFTPIAMLCNKEQFEAIKPKLKGMKIGCISNFNEWNYLVNNENGYPFVICNTGESGSKRYNRDIHETWNERIFLEACGIETEETFEITKETIIKYKMKDEFPEVFDVKLEVGKWYKNDQNAIFFTCNVNNKKPYGYGITAGKVFVEDDNFAAWSVSGIKLATEQEVFEALKNEAVKRGFVMGTYCSHKKPTQDQYKPIKDYFYHERDNCLYGDAENNGGTRIFHKGQWAKIIPTKTKEEAEKLLGVKIID